MSDDKIQKLRNALQDFVDFHDDPNMPMEELVERAEEALEETK
jgi:hypothetical protein